MVDAAMASEGAVTYGELRRLPLSGMFGVLERVSKNLRRRK